MYYIIIIRKSHKRDMIYVFFNTFLNALLNNYFACKALYSGANIHKRTFNKDHQWKFIYNLFSRFLLTVANLLWSNDIDIFTFH